MYSLIALLARVLQILIQYKAGILVDELLHGIVDEFIERGNLLRNERFLLAV